MKKFRTYETEDMTKGLGEYARSAEDRRSIFEHEYSTFPSSTATTASTASAAGVSLADMAKVRDDIIAAGKIKGKGFDKAWIDEAELSREPIFSREAKAAPIVEAKGSGDAPSTVGDEVGSW